MAGKLPGVRRNGCEIQKKELEDSNDHETFAVVSLAAVLPAASPASAVFMGALKQNTTVQITVDRKDIISDAVPYTIAAGATQTISATIGTRIVRVIPARLTATRRSSHGLGEWYSARDLRRRLSAGVRHRALIAASHAKQRTRA